MRRFIINVYIFYTCSAVKHFSEQFYALWIVNGVFCVLSSLIFYNVCNSIGYLMRDGCWLFVGYIYYSIWILNYNLDVSPVILYFFIGYFLFCKTFKYFLCCSFFVLNKIHRRYAWRSGHAYIFEKDVDICNGIDVSRYYLTQFYMQLRYWNF